jgi:hypothetical protein
MKDTLGAILAALLDIKWIVLGIVVGGLLVAKCASAAEVPSGPMQYSPLMALEAANARIMVQQGQFTCKEGAHRAIYVNEGGWVKIGCATVTERAVHIEWEAGPPTEVDRNPGHTDGPANEPPAHPGVTPERNS